MKLSSRFCFEVWRGMGFCVCECHACGSQEGAGNPTLVLCRTCSELLSSFQPGCLRCTIMPPNHFPCTVGGTNFTTITLPTCFTLCSRHLLREEKSCQGNLSPCPVQLSQEPTGFKESGAWRGFWSFPLGGSIESLRRASFNPWYPREKTSIPAH